MVKREYSFPPKPSKSQIFVPSKLGGIGGNGFRFNENFIEIPKLPLESQPSLFLTSRTNIFALSLPLLSHTAANHNQSYQYFYSLFATHFSRSANPNYEFFNCFDFIDLFTIKKFFNCFNCFAFIVSIVLFFVFPFIPLYSVCWNRGNTFM